MTHKTAMLRATVAVAALLFGHAAMADMVYHCRPYEMRSHASDRLLSVEVVTADQGAFKSVRYHAANGAYYDRGDQYIFDARGDGQGHYVWIGDLRSNPKVRMLGQFVDVSGATGYVERIYSKRYGQWRQTAEVISVCDEPTVVETETQPPPSTAPSSSESSPLLTSPPSNRDVWNGQPMQKAVAKYAKCLSDGTIAFALTSTEPAEVVIKAARGACVNEAGDLTDTAKLLGATPDAAQGYLDETDH